MAEIAEIIENFRVSARCAMYASPYVTCPPGRGPILKGVLFFIRDIFIYIYIFRGREYE
jgi:hypothetical protein